MTASTDSSGRERRARLVHGVVAFGGTARDAVHLAGNSSAVLRLALTFIDPEEHTPVPAVEIARTIEDAVRLIEAS